MDDFGVFVLCIFVLIFGAVSSGSMTQGTWERDAVKHNYGVMYDGNFYWNDDFKKMVTNEEIKLNEKLKELSNK